MELCANLLNKTALLLAIFLPFFCNYLNNFPSWIRIQEVFPHHFSLVLFTPLFQSNECVVLVLWVLWRLVFGAVLRSRSKLDRYSATLWIRIRIPNTNPDPHNWKYDQRPGLTGRNSPSESSGTFSCASVPQKKKIKIDHVNVWKGSDPNKYNAFGSTTLLFIGMMHAP